MKRSVLGIPDPCLLEDHSYNTCNTSRKVLVGSLLGGFDLNHIEHKIFVCGSIVDARKQREFLEIDTLTRRKDLAEGAGLNRLWRVTENGAWLTDIPQRLNGTELSRE